MNKVDKVFITILLLLQVNFFDIFPISQAVTSSISGYSQKKLMLVIVLIYCVVSQLIKINKRENIPSFFGLSIFTLLFIVLIVTCYSAKTYSQSIVSTFLTSYYFLIILLYYPIKRSIINASSLYWLINIVSKFGFWVSFIKIAQSGLKSFFNINIFALNTTIDSASSESMRFTFLHFVRLPSSSDFVFFSMVLLIIGFVLFKKQLMNLKFMSIFIIDIFFIIVIGQTRMYILMVALILALMLFTFLKSGNKVNDLLLLTTFLVIGCTVIMLLTFRLDLTNGDRAVSLTIRQGAISYFLNNINYNGFYGFGFARDDLYGYLIHGTTTLWWGGIMQSGYNYDDVGVFGFLAIFGYSGILFLIIYLSQILLAFLKSNLKILSFLVLLVLVMSMGSLSLFNPQRIMYLPFYLSILCLFANQRGELFK